MSKLLARVLAVVVLGLPSASTGNDENPLVGRWKSNEAMTVRYLHNLKGLSEEQREFLSNGFFGKFVHIFKRDSFTSFSTDDVPDEPAYVEYTVTGAGSESYIISYRDPELEAIIKEVLHFDGDCFYLEMGKSKIREYFCRAE